MKLVRKGSDVEETDTVICPLLSTAKEFWECLGSRCALYLDIEFSMGCSIAIIGIGIDEIDFNRGDRHR